MHRKVTPKQHAEKHNRTFSANCLQTQPSNEKVTSQCPTFFTPELNSWTQKSTENTAQPKWLENKQADSQTSNGDW